MEASTRFNASRECWQLYGELTIYTLSKNDPEFIHQLAVDAYSAQHSGGVTRNITTAFALIGLYLAIEQGYSGKQVQQAHMALGKRQIAWPRLAPPRSPGAVTVRDVLQAPPGEERDAMLRRWVESVWQTWEQSREWVRNISEELLGIKP